MKLNLLVLAIDLVALWFLWYITANLLAVSITGILVIANHYAGEVCPARPEKID